MTEVSGSIEQWLADPNATRVVTALLLTAVGVLLARVLAAASARASQATLGAHGALLLRRVVFYGISGLAVATAFHHLGINLGLIFGAAGVLTVAVGFASQTVASNFVSGLFLLTERPFSVGDVLRLGDTTGEVQSVDWLSVKLRTFDNILVRIPNEQLLKSQFQNLSRFPIRRCDLRVDVAYKEDLAQVETLLMELADREPLCLEEPPPLFIVLGFADSSMQLQFSVWCARPNFLALRNRMYRIIREAFDEHGIEIPFPHRVLIPRPEVSAEPGPASAAATSEARGVHP